MGQPTGYINPAVCVEHLTGAGHPERPARLDAVNQHLKQHGIAADLTTLQARPATLDEIKAVHCAPHVDRVVRTMAAGATSLDPDTVVSAKSLEAAYLAAGAAVSAIDALYGDDGLKRVFCGVRPPGHHAESDRAMGFCIFNNVAVAAQYARDQGLANKVLILDWDVHHGNGTQDIFAASADVFYYSLHQYPFYPGTGAEGETGIGQGRGFTLNRPLAYGTGDDEYLRLVDQDLAHIAASFQPDLVIVSAGFDAHDLDPLGGMRVSTEGFARLTGLVMDMADHCAEGRILSVLEGGYNLDALGDSVVAHLRTFMDG